MPRPAYPISQISADWGGKGIIIFNFIIQPENDFTQILMLDLSHRLTGRAAHGRIDAATAGVAKW